MVPGAPSQSPVADAPTPTEHVFYDGECGFCHRAVQFLLRRDPEGQRFRFAPLQGETFARLVPAAEREELPDALAVWTRSGALLLGTDATAHLLRQLPGGWPVLGALLAAIPRGLREPGYAAFARIRHKLFASPEDACPVLPPHERARFDD